MSLCSLKDCHKEWCQTCFLQLDCLSYVHEGSSSCFLLQIIQFIMFWGKVTLLLSPGRLVLPTCYNKSPLPGKRHQGQGNSFIKVTTSFRLTEQLLAAITPSLTQASLWDPECHPSLPEERSKAFWQTREGSRSVAGIWASEPLTPSLVKCPPKRQQPGLSRKSNYKGRGGKEVQLIL